MTWLPVDIGCIRKLQRMSEMGTITPLFKSRKPPVEQIDNIKNTFLLGLSAMMLFTMEGTPPMLENSSCSFGRHTVCFDQLMASLGNQDEKKVILDDFIKMLYRTFVQEAVFVVEDYCERSGQSDLLYVQPWYPFAKAIKDCFSNGFRFGMDLAVNDSMPIRWRKKLITENMRGESLQSSFFDFDDAWDLVDDIRNFVVSID